MSHEVKIHDAQTAILRALLFTPSANYSKLQKPTGLTSDHFNFHIKKLVELDFVKKVSYGEYSLTPKGKEYANKLDTDKNTIERQPKVAVLLAVEKVENDQRYFLFQERLKQPYFGFWCFPTGKIRWGETILEAAARELDEETGLKADFVIKGVYHEQVSHAETDESLEDKLFFVMHGINPSGNLIDDFEGGHNEWFTADQVAKLEKKFDSVDLEIDFMDFPDHSEIFIERHTRYGNEHF